MTQWYYRDGEQERGPVDNATLKRLARKGTLTPNTLLRKAKSKEWRRVGKAPALFGADVDLDPPRKRRSASPRGSRARSHSKGARKGTWLAVGACSCVVCLVVGWLAVLNLPAEIDRSGGETDSAPTRTNGRAPSAAREPAGRAHRERPAPDHATTEPPRRSTVKQDTVTRTPKAPTPQGADKAPARTPPPSYPSGPCQGGQESGRLHPAPGGSIWRKMGTILLALAALADGGRLGEPDPPGDEV